MNELLDFPHNRRNGVTVPTIWIAIALSLLVHVALMWQWLPRIRFPSLEDSKHGESTGSLVVQLAPPIRPAPALAPPAVMESQPVPPPRPRAPAPPPPATPVIALKAPSAASVPAPVIAPAPATPAPAPAPQRPSVSGDFAADLEARRRARGESPPVAPPSPGMITNAPAAEDDKARSDRIAAANLAPRRQTFGYDPRQGGGLFQIVRLGYVDAEFVFFGWDKNIRRNTKQLIEVQKGNNADTRIAIVRKMIAIIREYEREDFLWESQRLGRSLTLSARDRDNAGLEQFLMQEFFPEDPRVPR